MVAFALALAVNHYQVGCDCAGLPRRMTMDGGEDAGEDAGQLGDGGYPPEPRFAAWPRKISEARQDAFPITGSCRLPGGDIELSGAFSTRTPCLDDGGWRVEASFRAKAQGDVTVRAVQWSPDRALRSVAVSRTWVKETDVCDVTANRDARPFAGGTGTVASPLLICTATQLAAGIGPTDTVMLVNDLFLDGGFTTLTGPGGQWSGNFEGNGFVITNLTVPLVETLAGNGIVRSVRIENADITGFPLGHSGAIAGTVTDVSTVSDCSVSGVLTGPGDHIGALVGSNYGDIVRCDAQMTVNGGYAVGGLVGHNYGLIERSWSTGDATAPGGCAGGFVGRNDGDIRDCFSTGAGFAQADMGGGFIGEMIQGSTERCYSTGTATATDTPGGFIGVNSGSTSVVESYWNVETSALSVSALGAPLSSADLADAGTFSTWDFTDVWVFDPQRSAFPVLR